MTDDSLFTSTDNDNNGGDNNAPTTDPNKNYLEELVGEGKKFKDPNELARGKAEADAFIARLTREQEDLRKELNTRLTLEQYLDKMGANNQQNNSGSRSDPDPNEPNGQRPDADKTSKALSMEDVERLIEERERQRIQTENLRTTKAKLAEAFGSNYSSKLRETMETLGMSEEELNSLAASRPAAFLRLVGAQETPSQKSGTTPSLFTPPASSNTGQPSNRAISGDRTKSFYDDMKKRDPKTYWSPKVQNQLHSDALRLQEKFFDS